MPLVSWTIVTFFCEHVLPSGHDTLARCWVIVGPTSETAGRHWLRIGWIFRVCCVGPHVQMLAVSSQQAWVTCQLLGKWWFIICDAGPASNYQWMGVSCLLVRDENSIRKATPTTLDDGPVLFELMLVHVNRSWPGIDQHGVCVFCRLAGALG